MIDRPSSSFDTTLKLTNKQFDRLTKVTCARLVSALPVDSVVDWHNMTTPHHTGGGGVREASAFCIHHVHYVH